MTESLYNHLEIIHLLYNGNTKKALQEFTCKSKQLTFSMTHQMKNYLTSLNHGIYNFILIKENISLHNCCAKNDLSIQNCTSSTFLSIGEEIIDSYGSCFEYLIEKYKNEHVKKAITYIHQHLDEELTLENVSNEININKCYLCGLFKKEVQQTFSDYVLEQRIQLAKKLLKTTDHSIHVIAMKCGFNNTSYFSTCFKKLIGTTPSSIRQR